MITQVTENTKGRDARRRPHSRSSRAAVNRLNSGQDGRSSSFHSNKIEEHARLVITVILLDSDGYPRELLVIKYPVPTTATFLADVLIRRLC